MYLIYLCTPSPPSPSDNLASKSVKNITLRSTSATNAIQLEASVRGGWEFPRWFTAEIIANPSAALLAGVTHFIPGHVIQITNNSQFLLQPATPAQSSSSSASTSITSAPSLERNWGVTPTSALRVKSPLGTSKAAVYEVEIGKMGRKPWKKVAYEFVPDEGKATVAMKVIEWKSDPSNPSRKSAIKTEYDTNLSIFNMNPSTAREIIVPTFCYAEAGYQSEEGAKVGDRWDGLEEMKILISVSVNFDCSKLRVVNYWRSKGENAFACKAKRKAECGAWN